jgi:hypothetical protein
MFEGSRGFVAWRVMLCSIMLAERIFLLEKGRELWLVRLFRSEISSFGGGSIARCDGIVCGDREPAGMCYFVRAISECIHCV